MTWLGGGVEDGRMLNDRGDVGRLQRLSPPMQFWRFLRTLTNPVARFKFDIVYRFCMSLLKYGEHPLWEDPYVSRILVSPSNILSVDYTLEAPDIGENEGDGQNADSAKELFWRMLFGDAPMPAPKSGTVEMASGMLGRDVDLTDEAMETGIAQLDQ